MTQYQQPRQPSVGEADALVLVSAGSPARLVSELKEQPVVVLPQRVVQQWASLTDPSILFARTGAVGRQASQIPG